MSDATTGVPRSTASAIEIENPSATDVTTTAIARGVQTGQLLVVDKAELDEIVRGKSHLLSQPLEGIGLGRGQRPRYDDREPSRLRTRLSDRNDGRGGVLPSIATRREEKKVGQVRQARLDAVQGIGDPGDVGLGCVAEKRPSVIESCVRDGKNHVEPAKGLEAGPVLERVDAGRQVSGGEARRNEVVDDRNGSARRACKEGDGRCWAGCRHG